MARGTTDQTTPVEGQDQAADTGAQASAETQPAAQGDQAAATTPATDQTTPEAPKKASGGKIKNKTMAGQRVFAASGKPIDFDEKGVASVEGADFDYLASVPGYEKA